MALDACQLLGEISAMSSADCYGFETAFFAKHFSVYIHAYKCIHDLCSTSTHVYKYHGNVHVVNVNLCSFLLERFGFVQLKSTRSLIRMVNLKEPLSSRRSAHPLQPHP
jgi:hypothetical protein